MDRDLPFSMILARPTGEFKLGGIAGSERMAGYGGPGRCAGDHRTALRREDRRVYATGESPPPDSDQEGRAWEPEMSSGTRAIFPGTRDVAPVRRGRRIGRSRGMPVDEPGRSPRSPTDRRETDRKQTPEPPGSAGPDRAGGR